MTSPTAEHPVRGRQGLDGPLVAFFGIAFALAWGMWLVVAWVADQVGIGTNDFLRLVEERRLQGVDTALPGWLLQSITRVIDFSFSIAGLIMIGVTAGRTGFGEHGRRLLLQRFPSPFRASLIIGVLWGAWHLPVLITRDPVSIVLFLVLALGLSFVFTLIFTGSGGSLIFPGLLFHATVNWEEGFEALMPGLIGTDREIWSTLALLLIGLVAAVQVARRPLGAAICRNAPGRRRCGAPPAACVCGRCLV